MATRHKIDRSFLRKLEANDRYQEYSDQDMRGLSVRVSPSGRITYLIRWSKPDRRQASRVIGSFPETNPSQARDRAAEELRNVEKLGDTSAEVLERHRRLAEAAAIRGTGETLGSYLEGGYAKYITIRYKSADKTVKRIKACFRNFLDFPLSDVSQQQIEDWRYEGRRRGLKNSTLEREVNALKGLFSRAVREGVLAVNPLSGMEPLPIPREGRVRWLLEDEKQRLRKALDYRESRVRAQRASGNEWRHQRGHVQLDDLRGCSFVDHLHPMILLSLNTGLRQGELLSLKWDRVDLSLRMLTVTAAHSKSSAVRHIPLNSEAYKAISDWRKQVGGDSGGYVFEGQEGEPLGSPKTAWKNLLIAADIENFTWHDMRHDFASRLVMAGVDLNTVRELLGHADIKMTLRYAHLAPAHKAAAVAALDLRVAIPRN